MRVRGFAISAIMALVTGWAIAPAVAGADPGTDDDAALAQVYEALGVAEVPTDYVVLVDASGSMATDDRYGQVKKILQTFLESLRPADSVTLMSFAGTPNILSAGHVDDPAAVVSRMPTPNGSSTDIGTAIGAGLAHLATGNAESAAIVLFTDGEHAPAAGSPFPNAEAPAWSGLATQAAQLSTRMTLRGFAFPLTGERSGAELLGKVVPGTEVPHLGLGELKGYLAEVPNQLRRTLAARALAPDLKAAVDVAFSTVPDGQDFSDDLQVAVTVTPHTKALPLTLVHPEITSSVGAVTGLPARVDLEPGKPTTVIGTWQPDQGGGFAIGAHQKPATGQLRFRAGVDTPWRDVIEGDLATKVDLKPLTAAEDVTGIVTWGVSWLIIAAIILLLLAGAAIKPVLWLRKTVMSGSVVVDPPMGSPVRIELNGKRRVRIDRGRTGRSTGANGPCLIEGGRPEQPHGRPVLTITYTPHGQETYVRHCPAGEHQEIAGLRFWYYADERGTPFVEDSRLAPTPY
jgi:hypothetical protein